MSWGSAWGGAWGQSWGAPASEECTWGGAWGQSWGSSWCASVGDPPIVVPPNLPQVGGAAFAWRAPSRWDPYSQVHREDDEELLELLPVLLEIMDEWDL